MKCLHILIWEAEKGAQKQELLSDNLIKFENYNNQITHLRFKKFKFVTKEKLYFPYKYFSLDHDQ